jgi:hypothetical protein
MSLSTKSEKASRSVHTIICNILGDNLMSIMFLSFLSVNSYRLSVLKEVLIWLVALRIGSVRVYLRVVEVVT